MFFLMKTFQFLRLQKLKLQGCPKLKSHRSSSAQSLIESGIEQTKPKEKMKKGKKNKKLSKEEKRRNQKKLKLIRKEETTLSTLLTHQRILFLISRFFPNFPQSAFVLCFKPLCQDKISPRLIFTKCFPISFRNRPRWCSGSDTCHEDTLYSVEGRYRAKPLWGNVCPSLESGRNSFNQKKKSFHYSTLGSQTDTKMQPYGLVSF